MKILQVKNGLYFKDHELIIPVGGEKIPDPHAIENISYIERAIWKVYNSERLQAYLLKSLTMYKTRAELMAWLIGELALFYKTDELSAETIKSAGFKYLAEIMTMTPDMAGLQAPEKQDLAGHKELEFIQDPMLCLLRESGIPVELWEMFNDIFTVCENIIEILLGNLYEVEMVDPTMIIKSDQFFPCFGIMISRQVNGQWYQHGSRYTFESVVDLALLDNSMKRLCLEVVSKIAADVIERSVNKSLIKYLPKYNDL